MDGSFFFKKYHFATGFRGRVEFFSSLPLAARLLFYFFCLFVCFLLLRLVKFFLVSTAGEVVFFFQKTSMPPISNGAPLVEQYHCPDSGIKGLVILSI